MEISIKEETVAANNPTEIISNINLGSISNNKTTKEAVITKVGISSSKTKATQVKIRAATTNVKTLTTIIVTRVSRFNDKTLVTVAIRITIEITEEVDLECRAVGRNVAMNRIKEDGMIVTTNHVAILTTIVAGVVNLIFIIFLLNI